MCVFTLLVFFCRPPYQNIILWGSNQIGFFLVDGGGSDLTCHGYVTYRYYKLTTFGVGGGGGRNPY